jgi:excisionase family DNA binding protein
MTTGLLPMVDEQLLTVPQVAARLQVTEDVVRDWLRSGRLRGYRPGGAKIGWRVSATDVQAFLDAAANRPRQPEEQP